MCYSKVQINVVGRQRVPLPFECFRLQAWPNEHVHHVSYGYIMKQCWSQFRGQSGMLWIEGDIAIDPRHLEHIDTAVALAPDVVIAVPYILWPATTKRDRPCWSNRDMDGAGKPTYIDASDEMPMSPAFFSLGCTYLPAGLLDSVSLRHGNWDYPCLDTRLSELARELSMPVIATPIPAIHLHY